MKNEKMIMPHGKEIFMASKVEMNLFKELEALRKEMNFESISDLMQELLTHYEIKMSGGAKVDLHF